MLCALFAGVFRYIDDHFHTPETFFENTQSLADNADVRERLFNGFRAELISIADGVDLNAPVVDDPDAEADDDPLGSLGGDDAGDEAAADDATVDPSVPITDARVERDQAIEEVLLDVFDSDLYDQVFDEQLALIQSQLIRSAELPDEALLRDSGQVSFDARRLYQPIYTALAADPRAAELTQNPVPDSYGIYSVADRETAVNAVWWFIENGPSWRGLTFALAIVSLIGAVAVAERRPTRAIQYGGGMVGLALVVIVVIYIVRAIVPLLAGGSGGDGTVVAVYAANLGPLVGTMIRLLVMGAILAAVGGVARLIWPDDWVYGQVTDDRGVRSIRRRRSAPEVQEQQQPTQVAAAVPVAYPGYAQPYATYPPGWGAAPYPGQPYGVPYQAYPTGPYAQPVPAPYATARGTMPVVPGGPETTPTGENPQLMHGVPSNGLPADAATSVPRVVAAADEPAHSFADAVADDPVDDEPGEPTSQHVLDDDDDDDAGHDDGDAGSEASGDDAPTSGSDAWDDDSDL